MEATNTAGGFCTGCHKEMHDTVFREYKETVLTHRRDQGFAGGMFRIAMCPELERACFEPVRKAEGELRNLGRRKLTGAIDSRKRKGFGALRRADLRRTNGSA